MEPDMTVDTETTKVNEVEKECDDIVEDLREAFEIVHTGILDDIEKLVTSLPDDITEAPASVSTDIIRIQSDLTKLRIKVNHEFKMLALYQSKMDTQARRRKLDIKSKIAGQPTGKMTLKELVNKKYNDETDLDIVDYIAARHTYANACLKEIDETRELLRTISIQWHSAGKRRRDDKQNGRTNEETT
jgi:hypothetical protein